MKKIVCFFLIVCLLVSIFGCTSTNRMEEEGKEKPVKVIEVQEEIRPIFLEYIGTINGKEIKKYSFKQGGKIGKIHIEKGQYVQLGDKLIELDLEDLQTAYRVSKAQMDASQAQYDKAMTGASEEEIKQAEIHVQQARDAYEYTLDLYDKMQYLYQEGAISKHELDTAKLELDLRTSEYNAALEMEKQIKMGAREEDKRVLYSQLQQARADYEYKQNLLRDGIIKADMEGYIVDILYKEGEMVPSGHPVVLIRSEELIVQSGLSQQDVNRVKVGAKVLIKGNEKEAKGEVSYIHSLPQQETLTYAMEICFQEPFFYIGEIVRIYIEIAEEMGIMIPIQCIMTGHYDYVFTVEEGKALKKKVEILRVEGDKVAVRGLTTGEQLVVQGMKNLKEGEPVIIKP